MSDQLPPHLRPPKRSRAPLFLGIGVVAVVVAAFLAFGVFGVHTAFIDEEVSAEDPFATSESDGGGNDGAAVDDGADPGGHDPAADDGTPVSDGDAVVVATGSFEAREHAGEGMVTVGTVGGTPTVHFGDDFATDNGPDLYAAVIVDGERVELEALAGNVGSQTYEVPDGVDPATIETVQVWCKRFDVVFTEATVG